MSAEEFKEKGNEFLKKGDMENAVNMYSEGIKLDSNNYVLYSNRCTAYLQLKSFQKAFEDAQKVISLNSGWAKGYLRCGQALYGLGRLQEAIDMLNKGLGSNPDAQTQAQLQKTLADVQQALQQQEQKNPFAQLFNENMFSVLATNPQLKPLLQDQDFMAKVKLVQQNPNLINTYLQTDPRFMNLMMALLQAKGFTGMEEDEEAKKEEERNKKEKEEEERNKKEEEEEKEKLQSDPAVQEKNKGNEFFSKKQYEQALSHYLRAIELNPNDMVYYLNTASCLMELGRFEEGIKYCEEALEVGRKHHADFQMIAKALARIGNAYFRMENYKKAIEYYNESLTEHRNREIVQRKMKAEQLLRKQEELAYLNPELAEEHRQRGNQYFQEKKFPEAIKEYTEAIKRNPSDAKLYVNRATTYIKLASFPYALKDVEKALELDPKYVKAYARKGQCHMAMKEYHKSLTAYDTGLKLDPNNEELKQGKMNLMQAIATSGRDEERIRRAQEDPEIQAILTDPAMRQILNDLSSDPKAAQQHLSNPMVADKINKLIAAGILQVQ